MTSRFRVGVTNSAGVYKQYALHDRARLRDVGVYLGSDALADVPIDDAERWHAHLVERDGQIHLDVIAGDVTCHGRRLTDGDSEILEPGSAIQIARSTIAIDVARQENEPDRLIARSNVPNDLFDASRLLRVRLFRGKQREVYEVRPFLDQVATIRIGDTTDCDIVVPDMMSTTATLQKGDWRRFGIAPNVSVQLCRWPRHSEQVQMLWEPPAPRPEPPLPAPMPPPPPPAPIDLGVELTERRGIAALVAYIRAQPSRARPPRAIAHALEAYSFAPVLAELFRAWAEHQVGRIFIGELAIGDGFLEKALPVMIKGELYGEVDVDHSQDRVDLLVIGRHHHRYVAFRRYDTIDDSPIEIDVGAGTESWCGTLGETICRAMRESHARGRSTDLDPYVLRAV